MIYKAISNHIISKKDLIVHILKKNKKEEERLRLLILFTK